MWRASARRNGGDVVVTLAHCAADVRSWHTSGGGGLLHSVYSLHGFPVSSGVLLFRSIPLLQTLGNCLCRNCECSTIAYCLTFNNRLRLGHAKRNARAKRERGGTLKRSTEKRGGRVHGNDAKTGEAGTLRNASERPGRRVHRARRCEPRRVTTSGALGHATAERVRWGYPTRDRGEFTRWLLLKCSRWRSMLCIYSSQP